MLIRFIRLKPFDTGTEQGRSEERYRLAALALVANVASRTMAMLAMVLSVSLMLPFLGTERFGAWMTIASLVGMLAFLDLGVGNALTNKVAQAATADRDRLANTISGGLGLLFMLGCSISLLLIAVSSLVPWAALIKLGDASLYPELQQAILLFGGLFGLSIFSNGIHRVFAGLQRAFESHLLNAFGSMLTLLLLWYAVDKHTNISALLLITMGVQIGASFLLLMLLVRREQFQFARVLGNIRSESPHLLKYGGLFLLLQIGVMIGWGADSLIISSSLGAGAVAGFALVQKLFQMATLPMSIMNAPLWGAYADAHARGDKKFIGKTLFYTMIATLCYSSVVSLMLVIFGELLAKWWSGNLVFLSTDLLLAYGFWTVLEATGHSLAMFLNGCNIIRPQVISVTILCLVAIPIKWYLINSYGLAVMIGGFALNYLAITLFFYGQVFRGELHSNLK